MKKMPYGISNYETIMTENYYYVDKTKYIEKLEDLADRTIMFLRPRKFGKTLFTSVLENYYDIKKQDKFETLFEQTYIGKNPTKLKNSYYILRFNFSGINTETVETTMNGFKNEVISSINKFIQKYNVDFTIGNNIGAEGILNNFLNIFEIQKPEEKIYVIIDEYDHFANELLSFQTEQFKNLVSKNGKVRKWYEILKKGTETVVGRIFITGVAPITLDSLTSGFNTATDITRDIRFNEMFGFTLEEIQGLLKEQKISEEEQEKILPIMKENYDGYKFSLKAKNHMYNSNMCLYFLTDYIALNEMPERLIDMNIASDYAKLSRMLDLCKGEKRKEIIEKTVLGEGIISEITDKFNPEVEFKEKEMISMLFYLGYLTIVGQEFYIPELKIPNKVMKEIYADYFMEKLNEQTKFEIEQVEYVEIMKEIALEGKIEKITEMLGKYLNNLSNRDYQNFDEKYVKLIFYCIAMSLKIFYIKSEIEVKRKYPDILLIPREIDKEYYAVMIEFKYLKKTEENKLEEKQKEARDQIIEYGNIEEIRNIKNLRKYTVIAVNDKIYVEEIS